MLPVGPILLVGIGLAAFVLAKLGFDADKKGTRKDGATVDKRERGRTGGDPSRKSGSASAERDGSGGVDDVPTVEPANVARRASRVAGNNRGGKSDASTSDSPPKPVKAADNGEKADGEGAGGKSAKSAQGARGEKPAASVKKE